MRQLKRISFFIYTCLIFTAGFLGHVKFEETFYPGRQSGSGTMIWEQTKDLGKSEVVAVSQSREHITSDTMLEIQVYDAAAGSETVEHMSMPGKYIGLDREAFLRCIADLEASPTLAEKNAGLYSVEVLSFSAEKIVLKKSYYKKETAVSYYLVLEQNMVVVYEADRSTVYLRTVIDGRNLPSEIRYEILRGMAVDSRDELEKFLESYST